MAFCDTCTDIGRLLGGEARCEKGVCAVHLDRERIQATIEGRPVGGGEVLGIDIQISAPDAQGRSLCLGEVTLLEGEVSEFVRGLSWLGIQISAIHNHWLEDRPRLVYLHFQTVMNPVRFARSVAPLIKRLT